MWWMGQVYQQRGVDAVNFNTEEFVKFTDADAVGLTWTQSNMLLMDDHINALVV